MALPNRTPPYIRATRRRRNAEGRVRTIVYGAGLVLFVWFVASVVVDAIVGFLAFVLTAGGWL
jgi:hypothetical protein